jgi:CDP-glycerol glycerophosphotransferase (TagB/SpsB family)
MDPDKVVVTGLPQWDGWAQEPDKEWARRALRLDADKPVVAFMSSWPQATSALGIHDVLGKSYEAFLNASLGADWQAIVKLHPGSSQELANAHIEAAREKDARCMVTPQYLEFVLTAADLIVTAGPSNVSIEAAMIGVPSVSVCGYPDDDEVLTVDPSDLADAIEEGLSREVDLSRFVEKYAYRNDGKATERVVELVREICL